MYQIRSLNIYKVPELFRASSIQSCHLPLASHFVGYQYVVRCRWSPYLECTRTPYFLFLDKKVRIIMAGRGCLIMIEGEYGSPELGGWLYLSMPGKDDEIGANNNWALLLS